MIVPIILFSLFICGGIIFCVKNFKKIEKPTNGGSGVSTGGGYREPIQQPEIKDEFKPLEKLPVHKVEVDKLEQIKLDK